MMKTFMISILFVFMISAFSFANKPPKSVSNISVIDNLLVSLNSDNQGVLSSSAQLAAHFNTDKTIVPLLKILKSNNDEYSRMSAAYSLIELKDSRGVFAVKQAIKFDDSKKVRDYCNMLYTDYLHEIFAKKNCSQ